MMTKKNFRMKLKYEKSTTKKKKNEKEIKKSWENLVKAVFEKRKKSLNWIWNIKIQTKKQKYEKQFYYLVEKYLSILSSSISIWNSFYQFHQSVQSKTVFFLLEELIICFLII
jgi:hypothetical protein